MNHPAPTHPCPVRVCPREVPDHWLMCGIHWRMVPHSIQRSVNAAYDQGRGRGSLALLQSQRAAIRAVNDYLERPADV